MTVICGTDFSPNAAEAELAAALIAKRLHTALELVHVIESRHQAFDAPVLPLVGQPVSELLAERAKMIEQRHDIETRSVVLEGPADERLANYALESQARLVVVSSLGAREQQGFLVGSVAERIVQRSTVPVLVVRDANRIRAWLQGEKPLQVMLGVDLGASSRTALRWAEELREIAACDLQVVQVVWPAIEHSRLGVPGPISLEGMSPELQTLLERDLKAWVGKVGGAGAVSFVVSSSWGRIDSHLALLASRAQVDLLVVGTHQKSWAARVWQGSVSRGVLHEAPTNVACVPRREAQQAAEPLVEFRRVLIPTDFSDLANHAVGAGYGLLRSGGAAHLVHVRHPRDEAVPTSELEARLHALVPEGAGERYITTRVHVVTDHEPHAGIMRLAERLAVDAICMSTHGRSGVSELALGSQAREVLRIASQPVLLVKAARE